MLIHYCVIAFKNIWKYKVSASISILGLAFAIVCFVPILYWMDHETTYDSFYKDSEPSTVSIAPRNHRESEQRSFERYRK